MWSVTFSSAEALDGLSNGTKVDIEDDRLLVDVWIGKDIEENGSYENAYVSSNDGKVFGIFESITIEGERKTHIYVGEDNINNEVLDEAVRSPLFVIQSHL